MRSITRFISFGLRRGVEIVVVVGLILGASAASAQNASCEEWLDHSIALWRELEQDYRRIRRQTPIVRVGSPEAKAINALLDRGLSEVLARVRRDLVAMSEDQLVAVLREVEGSTTSSDPLPYLDDEILPTVDEFYAILGKFNHTPGSVVHPNPPILEVKRGGTRVEAFDHADDYREFRAGRGEDPFAIPRRSWRRLRLENASQKRAALDAVRAFRARGTRWADLDASVDVIEAQPPSVRATLDYLRQTWRCNGQDYRRYADWVKRERFDLSSAPAERGPQSGTFFAVPLPIVDYGPEFNRDLRRTVQIMTLLTERRLGGALRRVQCAAPQLLGRETSRGRHHVRTDFGFIDPRERESEPLLRMVTEGVYSLAQALNFLMNDRVDGFERADATVEALSTPSPDHGISPVVEFTAMLRIGTLGRSSLVGFRFPRPVERNGRGGLALTEALRVDLGARAARDRAESREHEEVRNHRQSVRCPVARREPSGLQDAVDAFRRVYRAVHRHRRG